MLLDAVNAAYAVAPYGSYAVLKPFQVDAPNSPSAKAGAIENTGAQDPIAPSAKAGAIAESVEPSAKG